MKATQIAMVPPLVAPAALRPRDTAARTARLVACGAGLAFGCLCVAVLWREQQQQQESALLSDLGPSLDDGEAWYQANKDFGTDGTEAGVDMRQWFHEHRNVSDVERTWYGQHNATPDTDGWYRRHVPAGAAHLAGSRESLLAKQQLQDAGSQFPPQCPVRFLSAAQDQCVGSGEGCALCLNGNGFCKPTGSAFSVIRIDGKGSLSDFYYLGVMGEVGHPLHIILRYAWMHLRVRLFARMLPTAITRAGIFGWLQRATIRMSVHVCLHAHIGS